MLVWEAHKMLADAIGDSRAITSLNNPDGVRFFASHRCHALNLARLHVMNQLTGLARKLKGYEKEEFINGRFPHMSQISFATDTLANWFLNIPHTFSKRPYYISNAGIVLPDGNTVSLPTPENSTAKRKVSLHRIHSTQYPDPYFWITGGLDSNVIYGRIIDEAQWFANYTQTDPVEIHLHCILWPEFITPATSLTSELVFEPSLEHEMIEKAVLILLRDSQDEQNLQFATQLLGDK